jgi:hypothetical protein
MFSIKIIRFIQKILFCLITIFITFAPLKSERLSLKEIIKIQHLTVIILFFFLLSTANHAQSTGSSFINDTLQVHSRHKKEKKYNLYTQLKFDYGGIVESVRNNGIEDYFGIDLRMAWQKRKNDTYSALYKAPKYGIGLYSGNFNNNDFGKPFGIYGFMDFPIRAFYNTQSRWNWFYTIGLGMAFNFNYYDPEENPGNELLGSAKNVYIAFSLEGRYDLSDHWVAGVGAGFKHFSNGRIHLPNRGVNLLPFTFLVQYNFDETETDLQKVKLKFEPLNIIDVFIGVGNKNFEYGKSVYFKSTIGLSYLQQRNYKFRYGGGMELFYTAGSLDRIEGDKSNFKKQFSYGVVGIWEWVLNERLYIPLNVGVHFNYNAENFEQRFYQRLGLRYLAGKQKNIITGVGLKVTEFHADYVEWTVGYSFKNDKNTYKLLF